MKWVCNQKAFVPWSVFLPLPIPAGLKGPLAEEPYTSHFLSLNLSFPFCRRWGWAGRS